LATITSIEQARRRRVVSRFCTECRTAWSLIGVRRHDGAYVVVCKHCGHVRATIPSPRRPA
jgi:Zn ribbon nucleic-acid-binding protein